MKALLKFRQILCYNLFIIVHNRSRCTISGGFIMVSYERMSKILDILSKRKMISTIQLESLMYCSTSTLRRDLIQLEKDGKIIRSHGEVRLVTTNNVEYTYECRKQEETFGKKNIAETASTFLTDNQKKYGYKIKTFSDGASLYDSLNSGSVAAIMDDEPVIRYAIKQGKKFKTPIEGTPSGKLAFAVKKGSNPKLIKMFNNGLTNLKKNGTYDKILEKYLADNSSESEVDESTILGLLKNNYPQLLKGFGVTIALALLSFAIALVIGIIFGMFSVSPYKPLRWIAEIFVDVIRGVPLMILAAFIFWGIPNLIESITNQQTPINDFVAGTIALSLNSGAYIAEIVRGGIQAVPAGQMEASRSLGISYSKTMRKIILPQATKIMLPNFVNQFVIALKDTTIVSAIGLVELFQTGKNIIARNYQSFRMYAILAVLYLLIITFLTRLAKRLEKRIQ